MTRVLLLAGGFVLGWATCLFQALYANKGGISPDKARVHVDGGDLYQDILPTDDGHWGSRWWRHSDGFTTHIARRGGPCDHCGATEDGAG